MTTLLFSQPEKRTQTLRGRVIDQQSETPLIGASVFLLDSVKANSRGTTSNADGYYKLENIPVGRVSIQVSYLGYKPAKIDRILLKSGKELVLDFELEPSVIQMSEIVVESGKEKTLNDMTTVSGRTFSVEETEKYAGSWGDPARMATNFAGVFVAGDQRNDIIIRGNSPTGLLWQLEGIPIPSPNHFDVLGTTGGPISMLNNNLLARSDFFTSAFPAEYGNATSGVFDLKLRNGNDEKHEFLGQLGLGGFELGAEGPILRETRSSYLINLRYSMLGLVQKLLWAEGLPDYKDVSFKLNFPLKSGRISIFGIGGLSSITDIEEDETRPTGNYQVKNVNGSGTGILGLNYLHILNPETAIKTGLAFSLRRPHETVDSLLNEQSYLQTDKNSYRQNNLTLVSSINHKISSKNSVSAGIVIDYFSFSASRMTSDYDSHENIFTIDKPYEISADNLVLGQVYVQWKHQFTDEFYLSSGLNSSYFNLNNSFAADPRFGLSWQVTEQQTLGLGYGLHSQMQPVSVYFIRSKTGTDSNGRQIYSDLKTNQNLDFTRSHQVAVSHQVTVTQNLNFKTEIYYQRLFNVPVKASKGYFSMINSGAAMSVPEEDSLVNNGYGKNYGIEFTLEKYLSENYYFLVTASLFNSLFQGSDKVWRNTAYNGNYVLNTLGGYEFEIKPNIQLSSNLRVVYAGGRRLIPFDLAKSIERNDNVYIYNQAYDKQVKPYFRTDIRFGVIFQRPSATHELALDIANVTNHKNIYREKYNERAKKVKTTYMQGIFPMVLYRLNF
ncbi:MAG: TonB-dependent receptor [Bacteroidetes bacterium]|nr:TonB-dependent receptor [Bacteroidota bacterium]